MRRPGRRSRLAEWLAVKGWKKLALWVLKPECRGRPNYYAHFLYATITCSIHQENDTVSLGSLTEVIDYYEASLSMNPHYGEAQMCLGVAYRHKAIVLSQQPHSNQEEAQELVRRSRYRLERAVKVDSDLSAKVQRELEELGAFEKRLIN